MKARRDGPGWRVGFAGIDADLVFIPGGSTYQHDRGQRYWKIGVTLPNVDMAYQHLTRAGVSVSTPKQFLDIGYMCHLTDPNGFVIELLQQDFDGNRPAGAGDPKRPLGGGGRIGQITLRTGDIGSDDTCAKALGMTLLSLQDVADYGFDLHFYGYGTETPPQPDLWSVRNREWLWKRPYTLLEFQHIADARFAPVPDFLGIEIEGLDPATSDVVDGEFIAV
ncbi:MAG: VOC family protein [Pseudomonadota bacterium]